MARSPSPFVVVGARLSAAIAAAFGAEFAEEDPVLRPSQHADAQANAAMALAKRLGQSPRDVAAAIIAAAQLDDVVERTEIAGPGFINIWLRPAALGDAVTTIASDVRAGIGHVDHPDRVVIDYSSPTINKEMHVGHLRSTIIGDALVRVLEFLGHTVIRQNHYGDWGTNYGSPLERFIELRDAGEEPSLDDLNAFYKDAQDQFTSDPAFADRARARTVALQSGDPETLAVWRKFVDTAHAHNVLIYKRLGVLLVDDDVKPESWYNAELADTADELERLGVAVMNEGALCIFLEGYEAPLIIRKSDGGWGYGTTDMAAIRHRIRDLRGTRLLYVVDSRQSQHLNQVILAAQKAGWIAPPARAEHVNFGLVLGKDGKPLKSRAGDNPKLGDLLDDAVARAAAIVDEKDPDLDGDARARVARAVGIGAVKYTDLQSERIKDYTFDLERMVAFDGNTGPYLQYAHARIKSIFRRAGVNDTEIAGAPVALVEPQERALAIALVGFADAVEAVSDLCAPHKLCTYLFDLAQAFTAFYEACPVLKADDATRDSRLVLCAATATTLRIGLGLLGIEAPEQL
ncbi:MAG: arginyl-tRNA synthetase [Actinomycetota bacterium]|jgi:arginyl-tRNA synthetase